MTENGMPTSEAPWSVATLNRNLAEWIHKLGSVWVEGEITSWKVSNGHIYAMLRDLEADVKISITIWRSAAQKITGTFTAGDHVKMYGKPRFWETGGSLALNVTSVSHVGVGDLLERLERLRAQLQAEGLFDPAKKRPLPFLPQCIGLVTGRDSDAEKDVKRNALLRWPEVQFRTEYAAVQGERTVAEVVRAIETLDQDPEVDVIIVARGGGDFLHLLPFSDERIVRAAAAARTPLVSAIGHEADQPLLDFVADLRASTPTDAAKRVVPDIAEERQRVAEARTRMRGTVSSLIDREFDRVQLMRGRPVLAEPESLFEREEENVARATDRIFELVDRAIGDRYRDVLQYRATLRALSPLETLSRGYAVVQTGDGSVITDAQTVAPGDSLRVTVHQGRIHATAQSAEPAEQTPHK